MKKLLSELGVSILSHVIQMGAVRSKAVERPTLADLDKVDESPVRCFDSAAEAAMIDEVKAAAKDGDSLGWCRRGLGDMGSRSVSAATCTGIARSTHRHSRHEHPGREGGVEIGDGFEGAAVAQRRARCDRVDDETGEYRRESALAGGTEGGMTTGELLVVRAAMKPLATLNQPTLKTVDVVTKEATVSFKERTDVTAVPAMGVVAETMVALVVAAEAQRKFGGDSLTEFVRNAESFRSSLG